MTAEELRGIERGGVLSTAAVSICPQVVLSTIVVQKYKY
jgi:hypothetical protein